MQLLTSNGSLFRGEFLIVVTIKIKVPKLFERIGVFFLLAYRSLRYGCTFRRIPLTRGLFALVDPEDYGKLNKYKWSATGSKGCTLYAVRGGKIKGKTFTIPMHRQIMNAPSHLQVDHINRDGLDNRKANLRLATPSQNACNRVITNKPGSSKYKGVSWSKNNQKWQVSIQMRDKRKFLGYFDDEKAAARAYDKAAKRYNHEFAYLNFPDE